MSLEAELLAIDKEFWTGGPQAYADHCDDRCLVVFAGMAAVMPREEIAKAAEQGRWGNVEMKVVGLMRLSDTSAVIAYECVALRKDGQPHRALVTSGYVLRDEGWKLATHHQTEIPHRASATPG